MTRDVFKGATSHEDYITFDFVGGMDFHMHNITSYSQPVGWTFKEKPLRSLRCTWT